MGAIVDGLLLSCLILSFIAACFLSGRQSPRNPEE
jgi:hypothetical protein